MDQINPNFTTPESPESTAKTVYQTGNTQPPKKHRGLIAFLLICVILLGGLSCAMGLMNFHLFQQLSEQPEAKESSFFGFQDDVQEATVSLSTHDVTLPQDAELSMNMQPAPVSPDNIQQEGGLPLQDIYEKAIDSVVSVFCTGKTGTTSGTGVVLSKDGYIVTNYHVIENANSIEVCLADQSRLSAVLVGKDMVSDLAVLYVQASNLKPAEFGDSNILRVGDSVVAIGDPLGVELRGTMTDGIVSAINRSVTTDGRSMTLIQTNAALNEGNSGGPLLNCYGQVIGINTMKIGDYVSNAGVEGLGFAIPSSTVKEVVDALLTQGYVPGRPSFGVSYQEISVFDHIIYRLPEGLYITDVDPNSNAAAQGIKSGDVLTRFDGTRVTDGTALKQLVYSHDAGDTVSVEICRSGKYHTINVILDEAR